MWHIGSGWRVRVFGRSFERDRVMIKNRNRFGVKVWEFKINFQSQIWNNPNNTITPNLILFGIITVTLPDSKKQQRTPE